MPYSVVHLVPVRYIVSIMISLGMLFNYMLRVNINLTIVAMVNHTALPGTNITRSDECGGNSSSSSVDEPQQDGPFVWDEDVTGLILAAFYYGYVCTQVIGGRLAEVVSAKHVFGVAMLVTAALTLLAPVAASYDWRLLVALRAAMGLVLGVTFPASYVLLRAWVPLDELNFMVMMAQGSGDLGTTFTLPLSSAIIQRWGWEAVFYIQACLVIAWFLLWAVLVSRSPEDHWFISTEERHLITSNTGPRVSSKQPPVPWRQMLTSRPVWAYLIGFFGSNWCYYILLTDLPQYFNNMLGEDISSNALFNSLPYLGLWLMTLLYGAASDLLVRRGLVRLITVRRTAAVIAGLCPALLLVPIAFLGCSTVAVETLLVVTIVLQGAGYSMGVLPLDMAPNYAGTLGGLGNTLGTVPGFLGPLVVDALTEGNETLARWRGVFLIAAGLDLICATVLLIGCSVEEQPWNRHDQSGAVHEATAHKRQATPLQTHQSLSAARTDAVVNDGGGVNSRRG